MSAPIYQALELALQAIKRHPELAPCITVAQTEDSLWVTPWMREQPVTALLTWHDAMEDVHYELDLKGSGALSWSKVTIRGLMDGLPVVASAVTVREVNTPMDADELRRISTEEKESLNA